MDDQVNPRVALVFGDTAQIAHVRDALSGQAEIVAEIGAEFDLARLTAVHAQAVLVNLDGSDWLGDVAIRLDAAGIRTVFNDPEISRKLEGWDQARWRRHMLAKLRGSTDFDPPRPAFSAVAPAGIEPADTPAIAVDAVAVAQAAAPVVDAVPAPLFAAAGAPPVAVVMPAAVAVQADVLEQPLSLTEIEAMSVRFGSAPEAGTPIAEPIARVSAAPAVAADAIAADGVDALVADAAAEPAPEAVPEAVTADAATTKSDATVEPELDVDTAALSAMIDARLAEAAPDVDAAPKVWRVAAGGAVSGVDLPTIDADSDVAAATDTPVGTTATATAPTVAPVDEADVLQGMPALGDWQLVDPNEPVTPVAKPRGESPQPPADNIDFAGLELVPMESIVPIELHSDPIERWMGVKDSGKRDTPAKGTAPSAAPNANGERA